MSGGSTAEERAAAQVTVAAVLAGARGMPGSAHPHPAAPPKCSCPCQVLNQQGRLHRRWGAHGCCCGGGGHGCGERRRLSSARTTARITVVPVFSPETCEMKEGGVGNAGDGGEQSFGRESAVGGRPAAPYQPSRNHSIDETTRRMNSCTQRSPARTSFLCCPLPGPCSATRR